MKLELSKEWFDKNLPHDASEVGVCNPAHIHREQGEQDARHSQREDSAASQQRPTSLRKS